MPKYISLEIELFSVNWIKEKSIEITCCVIIVIN